MMEKTLSRREFLVSGGSFLAGATVGSMLGGSFLLPASANEVPTWPWPYKQLDPKAAYKTGYDLYYNGG